MLLFFVIDDSRLNVFGFGLLDNKTSSLKGSHWAVNATFSRPYSSYFAAWKKVAAVTKMMLGAVFCVVF